jgi:TonB family protein
MKAISQLLLSFLANAGWQVALIVAAAAVGAWSIHFLAPRRRHALWVAALFMSFGLPLLTCARLITTEQVSSPASSATAIKEISTPAIVEAGRSFEPNPVAVPMSAETPNRFLKINAGLAVSLAGFYLLFLLYRSLRLIGAWRRTRVIKRSAHEISLNEEHEKIFVRCQSAIGVRRVEIRSSAAVSVPLTVGIRRPLVILPERLLVSAEADVLMSAVGHELVHVLRRDYLLNLIYELIYLPLSFHPAAAMMRRKIHQTRELSCDELVTEKLLAAEVYAHSLVQLAGSAVPFGRQATLTVGITDADILEVRVMSLLRKPKLNVRRKKLSLIAAVSLLAVPLVAASAFGVRLDIKSTDVNAPASSQSSDDLLQSQPEKTSLPVSDQDQDQAKRREQREQREAEEKKRAESEKKGEGQASESEMRARREYEEKELRERESSVERELKEKAELDPQLRAELEERARHQEEEIKAKLVARTALARMAKITMEQAIQIANSQNPGKVMDCFLVGQGWESPGKLGKDGHALYHVVIVSPDETNPMITHVMVNALDGTILKTEREERGKENARPGISGGVLNNKAISMPSPEYPAIARAAQASGTVTVQVTVDEQGNVIAARAVAGHPLLQAASVGAARQAKFSPTLLSGEPVKITGVLVYNFVVQ